MSLFAAQALSSNPLITQSLTGFMAETLCPAVSMNASVCAGGAEIIGGSLLHALSQAILDPVYFCTNTLSMCNQSQYTYYHAEEFVNEILETKPDIIKNNDYLNKLYKNISSSRMSR
jgi:hypothetical protein